MASRPLFRLSDLPRAVSGHVVFSEDAVRVETESIHQVVLDSRQCVAGSLFFALPGAVTDGHRFVRQALENGATAALVSQDLSPEGAPWHGAVIQVPHTLLALQQLAAWYRRTVLNEVVRIGVTGSNGKTTTKEMVASILRCAAATSVSRGNLNSETGVPLAVFDTDPETRYAVFEMAMSNPDEMEPLAEIVQPDYALITNIGDAHIGMLGSRAAIAREKKKIVSRFSGAQVLFLPEDDQFRPFLTEDVSGTVIPFGPESQNARIEGSRTSESTSLSVDGEEFTIPMGGYHNGMNGLAAIALCRHMGISTECIRRGLLEVTLPRGRSEIVHGIENRIILNDSYNANPDSMAAALRAVHELHQRHNAGTSVPVDLVLVLGEMKELGSYAAEAHARVLSEAGKLLPALICLVGPEEWEAIPSDLVACPVERWSTVEEAARNLPDCLRGGETVLLKGSRSVALDRLLWKFTGSEEGGGPQC